MLSRYFHCMKLAPLLILTLATRYALADDYRPVAGSDKKGTRCAVYDSIFHRCLKNNFILNPKCPPCSYNKPTAEDDLPECRSRNYECSEDIQVIMSTTLCDGGGEARPAYIECEKF